MTVYLIPSASALQLQYTYNMIKRYQICKYVSSTKSLGLLISYIQAMNVQ